MRHPRPDRRTVAGSVRRPRADARRNRERLLAEAGAAFREQGTNASLEGIARRARRRDRHPLRALPDTARARRRTAGTAQRGAVRPRRRTAHGPSAAEALTEWVRLVMEHTGAYQGLAALLAEGADDESSELHRSCVRMTGIGDRLVADAREAGVLRRDATGTDIFALMNAATWTP